MGENEQGGMLRTVVVIGMVALIATVIIFAVVGLKGNMNKNTNNAVGTVVRTRADQPYKQSNVQWDSYTPPSPGTSFNPGRVYDVAVDASVPANYWLDTAVRLKFNTDLDLRVDVSNFPKGTTQGANDYDDWINREMQIYDDNGGLVYQQIGTKSDITNKDDRMLEDKGLKGGQWYTVVYRWHNNRDYALENNSNIYTKISLNSLSGSPISLEVGSIEMAKYDDKYKIKY